VINFEAYRQKLDAMTAAGESLFRGFSPRWTIPVQLKTTDRKRTTSCLLMVIDSAREVQQGIGPAFTQRVLGKNEIVVA
jgi:hypothetical protein